MVDRKQTDRKKRIGLLPVAMPHLLKFPEPPNIVPPAGDQSLRWGLTSFPQAGLKLPVLLISASH
jgi:hypothetical protein